MIKPIVIEMTEGVVIKKTGKHAVKNSMVEIYSYMMRCTRCGDEFRATAPLARIIVENYARDHVCPFEGEREED